jgi:hypothetical protein
VGSLTQPWLGGRALAEVTYPPTLPSGKMVVTDTSESFIRAPATLRPGVVMAKTPPKVDFLYFPGQTYEGKPWSNWGDSLAVGGKYYASIGDHLAPAGNAYVYEYDPATQKMRLLADLAKLLKLPEGHYAPGKIHSRIDIGKDGWLYFSTHRGSTRVTADKFHYEGDWIVRANPAAPAGEMQAEVVVRGPVPKHCIPASVVDGPRMIFYGATAPGTDAPQQGIQFFAYDLANKKLLYSGDNGPSRAMILAKSTGRLYYVPGTGEEPLMRFDPASGKAPEKIDGKIGIRAASDETAAGIVYAVSQGRKGESSALSAFNTKTETITELGEAAACSQEYVASLDVDATGRYLYYVPGAHGGSEKDGSAVIQYDTKTKQRKVLACLHPFYQEQYGVTLKGTYSTAIDPAGDKLYINWNANRGSKAWDSCALTVLHIPESERPA